MNYTDRFISCDNIVAHLTTVVPTIVDQEILSNYAGFLSVSSVTVYELAIKDVFSAFAYAKKQAFGIFVDKHFDRINGRIKLNNLRDEHIASFGNKYLTKFNSILDRKDEDSIADGHGSIKSHYGNIINCRHSFVHKGISTMTINEIINSYQYGKEVINSLNLAMVR